MPEPTFRVPTSDGELVVEVRGRGPPILFLHGVSAHRGGWHAVAERLDGEFRLYLADLLGRGESDVAPEARYGLADELRRAAALWEALSPAPELLVGHSQGAALALALAAERLPRGLVLTSPVTPWTRRPAVLTALRPRLVRRAAVAAVAPFRRPLARLILRRVCGPRTPVTRAMVERYAAPFADARRAEGLLRILADWRPRELADRLPGALPPTRLVAGRRDPRVSPGDAEALARRLGVPIWWAPGAGHVLPEEAPELIARAVRAVHEEAEKRTGTAP